MPVPESFPAIASGWTWLRPSEGVALTGTGTAFEAEAKDTAGLAAAFARLSWRHDDPDNSGVRPLAFIGHGFGGTDAAGFPPALLHVPRLLRVRRGGRTTLVFSHCGDESPETVRSLWLDAAAAAADQDEIPAARPVRTVETPPPELFKDRVARTVTAIGEGHLAKAVLSRRITVEGDRAFDPARVLSRLAGRYPACAILAAKLGGKTLVAASPERLVSVAGRFVESWALAGTAAFDESNPFLGRHLMQDVKERHEHRLVVDEIGRVLGRLCDDLDVPAQPRRMALGSLQHLWTPIRGRLRPGVGLLDAARRLHPTPAVAGFPQAAAKRVLAEIGEDRFGWYGGWMGWIDRDGDGDLAVVLRCAVIDGHQAHLSAGAGIVPGSRPNDELAETELKLRVLLEAL